LFLPGKKANVFPFIKVSIIYPYIHIERNVMGAETTTAAVAHKNLCL
jgi:hypothetical protein